MTYSQEMQEEKVKNSHYGNGTLQIVDTRYRGVCNRVFFEEKTITADIYVDIRSECVKPKIRRIVAT